MGESVVVPTNADGVTKSLVGSNSHSVDTAFYAVLAGQLDISFNSQSNAAGVPEGGGAILLQILCDTPERIRAIIQSLKLLLYFSDDAVLFGGRR